MSIIRTQLSGRQHDGGQSPLAVSNSSLRIKPSNSTYMSLSSTKLTDANHEISVKQSAQYNVRETDRYGENTQNSLPYSTRVTHAEAHTHNNKTNCKRCGHRGIRAASTVVDDDDDKNHILDLVIGSTNLSLAPSLSTTHRSPSDHFPIITILSFDRIPLPAPTYHSFSRLHSIDFSLKSSRLITTPPPLGSLLIAFVFKQYFSFFFT